MDESEEIARLTKRKDGAYDERMHLVAALARLFPSGVRDTDTPGWTPAWKGCVYLDLPSGQISYHYHTRHADLFRDLPSYDKEWDGHSKADVHSRLAALWDLFGVGREAVSRNVKSSGETDRA